MAMSMDKINIPSKPLVDRYPFPFIFDGDNYVYKNNARELESKRAIDITPEYFEEMKLKRKLLEEKKERTFGSLEHSMEGQWEVLDMIMHELASEYPDYFSLNKDGDNWTFHNHLLGEEQSFVFGDLSTLPYEPLDFIGRHVQEDLVFLGERDNSLYLDAGQLAFPADWSANFYLGMSFFDIHKAVPDSFHKKLTNKVERFIMRIDPGKPFTRYNWTLTVDPILDTAPENYDKWGPKKANVTADNAGELVHLRTEFQGLFRMPRSNGILFTIHTYLISFEELIQNRQWAKQVYNIMLNLDDDLAEYKGFISYKDQLVKYLEQKVEDSSSI